MSELLLAASTKLSVVSLSTAFTKATVPSVVFTTKSLAWTVLVISPLPLLDVVPPLAFQHHAT